MHADPLEMVQVLITRSDAEGCIKNWVKDHIIATLTQESSILIGSVIWELKPATRGNMTPSPDLNKSDIFFSDFFLSNPSLSYHSHTIDNTLYLHNFQLIVFCFSLIFISKQRFREIGLLKVVYATRDLLLLSLLQGIILLPLLS